MNTQNFDHYIDDDGNKDKSLTLNSEGFELLSDGIEDLISRLLGKDVGLMCTTSDELNSIREDLIDFLNREVN